MPSSEENQLIKIQTLFFFAGSLANIFLQVFLFKLGGFKGVVLFNLFSLIFLLIFYLLSGWSLKKLATKTLIQIGLIMFSLGWFLLLVLKEKAINYLIPIGIVFGIGQGNYWSGFNLSQYILTHQSTRENYFGKSNFFINNASAIGPLIGGLLILAGNYIFQQSYYGYYLLFFIVLVLNILNIILCRQLPFHIGINFSIKHIINHKRSKNWVLILLQQFILGLWDVSFGTLGAILLYLIIKNEMVFGAVNTLMAIFGAFVYFFAGKLLIKYKKLYLLGVLGTSMGILCFALLQNWLGIILLTLFTTTGLPFLNIVLSVAILNTIDEKQEVWQNKYHLFLERDTALGVARIFNFIFLFWLFSCWDKILVAKNWMMVISVFPLILGFLLLKMKPKNTSA